jgi:hypothetical protein
VNSKLNLRGLTRNRKMSRQNAYKNGRKSNILARKARKKIARSFNCGFAVVKKESPAGAAENCGAVRFCRPCGAWWVLTFYPQLKLRAIVGRRCATWLAGRAALPSYGESFSRCGWWSRFQRDKASSLVSSKRNCSVGDSTWPSQNTTLALP